MAGQNRTALAIVICGAILAGAGFLETSREVGPYLNAGVRDEQRFGAVIAGNYLPAASSMSKDLVVSDCLTVPKTVFAKVQPPSRQAEFAARCLDIARRIVAEVPTFSAGWLALATASAELQDVTGLTAGLVASQRTGADVHWLSEQRIALAAAHMDQLDDTAKAAYRLDVASLFDSRGGAEILATRYLANPAEQETIIAIGETVPAGMQRRFLEKVRELKSMQVGQ